MFGSKNKSVSKTTGASGVRPVILEKGVTGEWQVVEGEYLTKEEKKKKRRFVWLFWLLSVLALLIATSILLHELGYLRYPWESAVKPIVAGDLFPGSGGAQDGHLSNMTPEQAREQMQKAADESQFSFKINSKPVFANGDAFGTLCIENPNYNTYPMVVQITLDSTGEIIYDSGGIMPNQHIDNARLMRKLPAGNYEATASINAYDPNTQEWQGKAQAVLNITVES